jgi:uncharacterized membrane protein
MKRFQDFVVTSVMAGFLVLAPLYLAVLLLLKAAASLVGLLKPVARLLPDWMPAEGLLALILVLLACLLVGAALRTQTGRAARERLEHSLFERIPGYAVFKSLTLRLTGQGQEGSWRPAFAEIEEALVPAFIIEEFEDGRYTVFVPSVPTPFAGAVYVLAHERVHPLDVPFTQALKPISRWGAGCKDLVAAMTASSQDARPTLVSHV